MDKDVCSNFILVRTKFPDTLDSDGNYQIKDDEHFKKYCDKEKCNYPLEKVNAGCLYFFNEFFGSSDLFKSVAKSNINIAGYIMIWLSYMLNLKKSVEGITNVKHFYDTYIKSGEKYINNIANVSEYSSYKELVDKNDYFLSMDKIIISKLYDALQSLCNMYNEFNANEPNCDKCLEKANEFVGKYEKINEDPNNTNSNSYRQVLCTLSNDYDNFKKKCKDIKCSNSSSFPTIEKNKIPVNCPERTVQISDDASSSSIANKLFIVLSIFGAIGIFWGISYKYSLFGFRKRFKKQQIREKIKNIKKKINQ
ncbi:YIR protein [Plasmodium yoelii]|uniref:YIR protein n=1 Tax=Plasmodium yoelii TaxID=5861 RepID=A0A077X7X1_PLAYE|nr:YIR protein [Plasmodium yoelii]